MKQNTKQTKTDFYNTYHKKNDDYFEIIKDGNFTYFYIQQSLTYIYHHMTPKRVLDIGCGVGTIGFFLTTKGSIVDGYDVSSRAISIASNYKKIGHIQNINFYNKDVQLEKFESNYDLVTCTEVIEHLEDDEKMIETIHKSLKRKGYLLLSTPSINAPLFKLGLLRRFDTEVGHLRRYELNDLVNLISRKGFTVEKSYKVEGILRNSLFTLPLLGNLIRLIKGPLIPLFHKLDIISAKIFGESDLIIVARKN